MASKKKATTKLKTGKKLAATKTTTLSLRKAGGNPLDY
jgi:hypothetical protein